jgi:tRNA(Arg) A34 adenosine deaminase TadA
MPEHDDFIRQCHELAISAGNKGNHTFGALLVYKGQVIMTAENTVRIDNDYTRHAELNLVVKGQRAFSDEVLKESTLYTSTAPCMMCVAVIFQAGITRIVYSVSYEAFSKYVASGYQTIHCDEIFDRLGVEAEIVGPILEEEGLEVFKYWK